MIDDREPPPRRDQVGPSPLPAPPTAPVPPVLAPPTPQRRRRPWPIVAVVVVALGVIAVVVALAVGGGPFRLPDDIGGASRIEEGPFEGFMDSILEYMTQGVEGAPRAAGAAYGSALDPTHILIVLENPGFPPGAMMEQFKTGYDSPGDEIQLDLLIEETVDGVRYECAPTSDVTIPTTVCTWATDRTVGVLISFLSDRPEESMPLIQDARADVEG